METKTTVPRVDRDKYETKSAIVAVSGFILSVFFILWALIVLVRFYVFDNILYNIFLICMMTTGLVFNIFSLNLMLTDCTEFNCIFPFVVGAPVAIFWTVLSIFIPIKNTRFYSQFAFMPIALYDSSFYDGLGFQPNNTSVHPFAKAFMPENSFFDHTFIILIILVISAIAQIIFWFYTTAFYYKLKKEALHMKKLDESSSKTL